MTHTFKKIASQGRIKEVRNELSRLLAPAHAAISSAMAAKLQADIPKTESGGQSSIFSAVRFSEPADASTVTPRPYKNLVTKKPGIIQLLTEDKNFYTSVLAAAGIPITPDNLSFLMAWRQAEAPKGLLSDFNPFNIKVTESGAASRGAVSYASEQEGIRATSRALASGALSGVSAKLKGSDPDIIGAADALVSAGWASGSVAKKLLQSEVELDPPAIYRPIGHAFIKRKTPSKAVVTSDFGLRKDPLGRDSNMRQHGGTDIGGFGGRGAPAYAAYDGRIYYVNHTTHSLGLGGYNVGLAQEGTDRTLEYIHMDSVFVKPGETVRRGQILGTIGSAGTGVHLHLQARTNKALSPPTREEMEASVGTVVVPKR